MKTRLLLLLPLFPFLAVDVYSKQLEAEATLREIQLKATPRVSPRAMNLASLTSHIKECVPATYQVGSVVALSFSSSTVNASIVVSHAETGEVVYHELFSCNASTTVLIELDGCEPGLYCFEISTRSTVYGGEFTL